MKRILVTIMAVLVLGLGYYLFLIPYEFEVRFQAKTLPGDLIETIRIWNRSLTKPQEVKVDSFARLDQVVTVENRTYKYRWSFDQINDSTTKVRIQISEPGRRIANKVLVPFTIQNIEIDSDTISRVVYGIIKEHLQITKVKVIGEAQLDSVFCVCRSLETDQIDKAKGMMKDYALLTSFIADHYLTPKGKPMVRVTKWNHRFGKLKFDFCFPIEYTDSLPSTHALSFKKFGSQTVLKAEFRGNYITSDRAWYSLLQYAQVNGYRTLATPIEYFYDNPNTGMNEINWKAEVHLPILK